MHVATEDGTLTLEGRQEGIDGYIQGYFKSDIEDEGIRFKTTHDSLVITTMDHEPLVKMRKAPVTIQAHGEKDHVIVFQMLDTVFAESNDRTYRVLDVRSNTPVVQERGRFVTHSNFLANLQAEELYDPHQAIQYKVKKLLAHPATRYLKPAARALGEDMGIIGKDEPAALLFYATVMKLSEAFHDIQAAHNNYFPMATLQTYPNCDLTTCPPCRDDECMGMCGRNCQCWEFVCGDCCLHRGCEQHDVCCRDNGQNSFRCLFPFGFTCNAYSC